MNAFFWNRREFSQRTGAGMLLVIVSLAGAAGGMAQTNAPAAPSSGAKASTEKPASAEEPELNNWVEVGVGGNFVRGDKAQFQHQSGLPASAFGGITAFHYETPLDKKGLFSIDGRGIFDNHDYDLRLEATHPDKGYVRAGVRKYRQYYDGSGGYLPSNGLFFRLDDNKLAIDRKDIYFEAALTLPDRPVITFRYDHQTREGNEDSTVWGTTTLSGPAQTVTTAQKKITPTYLGIDETRDILAADISHKIGNTDLGLGLRYEWQRDRDSRNTLMQPRQGTASRTLTTADSVDSDMFNAHAYSDTRLNDKVQFTSGYSFTSLHSELGGSRADSPLGTSATDTRFANLSGGSLVRQYTMSLALMYSPTPTFEIVPSIRVEKEDNGGASQDFPVTGVNTVSALPTQLSSEERALSVAESLDLRYSGLTNWAFYARAELSEDSSNLKFNQGAGVPMTLRLDNDWERLQQKYTVGANWYPIRHLNFAAQYYHKISDNDYHNNGGAVTAIIDYPGVLQSQRFNVDNMNFRVNWRVLPTLSLVSRYDFQLTTIDTRATYGVVTTTPAVNQALGEIESGNNTTHRISETISWTPLNRLYLQAGVEYVMDTTHTPVEDMLIGTPPVAGVVGRARNDYWTFNGLAGYGIDDKTDVQASYAYYRAADYLDNTAVGGLPLGAGGEEHTVSGTLTRRISKTLTCSLRYSYANYRDQLFGGNLNYEAHGIWATLRYRF